MWNNLSESKKKKYKELILGFSSLTKMFAQKSIEEDCDIIPIINSKYQETSFQRAFNACAEDIGNTAYDVSLKNGEEKYLIGIKTFGYKQSNEQKVMQFKRMHNDWNDIIETIKINAEGLDSKQKIDAINYNEYVKLAKEISRIRNEKIDSALAKIRGFSVEDSQKDIKSLYHVLMPSIDNNKPQICVGETSYDKIDINNIKILGCTTANNPTNFKFEDGNHIYKYTAADSQLYMNFMNEKIVCEKWDVKYLDNAQSFFLNIANQLYEEHSESLQDNVGGLLEKEKEIEETHCWTIWNKNCEMELFSGFNNFYGFGVSKLSKESRKQRIHNIFNNYAKLIDDNFKEKINEFLAADNEKEKRAKIREQIIKLVEDKDDSDFTKEMLKILYRPMDEIYIPIPNSRAFHEKFPNFFGKNYGKLKSGTKSLILPKEKRRFNLVFEPSGDILPAYITQEAGKAIESVDKQAYLGKWILREVFQLAEYEPLNAKKLKEMNINGLRFYKYKGSDDIHVEFIWIDANNLPEGYVERM